MIEPLVRLDSDLAEVVANCDHLKPPTLVTTIRQMATPFAHPGRQIGFVIDPQEKKT